MSNISINNACKNYFNPVKIWNKNGFMSKVKTVGAVISYLTLFAPAVMFLLKKKTAQSIKNKNVKVESNRSKNVVKPAKLGEGVLTGQNSKPVSDATVDKSKGTQNDYAKTFGSTPVPNQGMKPNSLLQQPSQTIVTPANIPTGTNATTKKAQQSPAFNVELLASGLAKGAELFSNLGKASFDYLNTTTKLDSSKSATPASVESPVNSSVQTPQVTKLKLSDYRNTAEFLAAFNRSKRAEGEQAPINPLSEDGNADTKTPHTVSVAATPAVTQKLEKLPKDGSTALPTVADLATSPIHTPSASPSPDSTPPSSPPPSPAPSPSNPKIKSSPLTDKGIVELKRLQAECLDFSRKIDAIISPLTMDIKAIQKANLNWVTSISSKKDTESLLTLTAYNIRISMLTAKTQSKSFTALMENSKIRKDYPHNTLGFKNISEAHKKFQELYNTVSALKISTYREIPYDAFKEFVTTQPKDSDTYIRGIQVTEKHFTTMLGEMKDPR